LNSTKRVYLTYLPILIWTLIILKLSTGPGVQIPFTWDDIVGIDKLGHLFFYLVHTILLYWTFEKQSIFKTRKQRTWWSFLLSTTLGILLEIVQFSFYPNRYFEILDIIANIIGSYLGTRLFTMVNSKILMMNEK